MLNDRNHVNTLIDEMFASVLEVSPPYDDEEIDQEQEAGINDGDRGSSVTLPQDSTKIIVRSDSKEKIFQQTPPNTILQNNKVVISNSLSDSSCSSSVTSTEMLPKTVIVIKNGDDSADDNISIDSATRDRSGSESNYNSTERAKQVIFFWILEFNNCFSSHCFSLIVYYKMFPVSNTCSSLNYKLMIW